jgi:superfamily II DNA or RNA helicase
MSVFTVDDIPWGEPKVVQTRNGPRRIREWSPPRNHPFWELWRTGYLRQQGYKLSKWKGVWRVTEWRMPDGSESSPTAPAVAAERDRDQIQHRFEQVEPELPADLQERFDEVVAIYEQIMRETGQDFRYQLPSIKRLATAVDSFDGGLDASDTGAGKTPVACGVARTLGRQLFVICPKAVITPWKRMARKFGVRIRIINYEMLRTGNTEFGQWVEEVNPRTQRTYKRFEFTGIDRDDNLLVFDECHRMKDYRTLNSAVGIAAIDQGYKVLALSATAADNPMHMKFVGLLTDLIRHPAHYYGWMSQNGVKKGRFGLEFVGGRDVLSRIHRQIFPAHGSRIRISDLGDAFPQTQIISEAYQMNGVAEQIQHVYDEMHAEIARLEASKQRDRGACILTEILRARQMVELLKVPTFVSMAEDARAEGMAVVVILNFQDSVNAVARKLRTTNTITGEDVGDKGARYRQRLIDRFNADDEDIVVMNIKAGGVGISLHGTPTGKPRLVLVSPTFSGIDLKQALGRCHRAGGAHSIQKIVWAADTIEERACDKVRARIERVSIFNDDSLDGALEI